MTDVKPPFMGDMPDSEYFKYPAVDQTQLKDWAVSPLRWAVNQAGANASLPAFRFGTAAHALVLGSGAPVAEAPNRRTKAGKAEAAKLEADGATVLNHTDFTTVHSMAQITHPVFKKIGGRPETAMIAQDPQTGVLIKGKADWLPDHADSNGVYWIHDYKTYGFGFDRFGADAYRHGYHVQAAFYIRLYHALNPDVPVDHIGFRFLVQEKSAPFDYRLVNITPGTVLLDDSQELVTAWLNDWKSFKDDRGKMVAAARKALQGDTSDWQPYVTAYGFHQPTEINLPEWALSDLDIQASQFERGE